MRRYIQRSLGTASLARGLFMFTEQDKVLQAVATMNKFKSNVWIEKEDFALLKTDVKPNAQPIMVNATKRLELFNMDQVSNAPAEFGLHNTSHSSCSSSKPYGQKLSLELEQKRLAKGFQSFWWIGRGELKKRGLALRTPNEMPSVMLLNTKASVYNSEQLINPDAARFQPLSAATKKPYHGDFALQLVHHIRANAFTTGLYLTERQAAKFQVEIRPGEVGIPTAMTSHREPLYNVEDFEKPEDLCSAFGRLDAQQHSFLASGRPMWDDVTVGAMQYNETHKYTKHFWISKTEAAAKGFALKSASGAGLAPLPKPPLLLFNADQTTNRNEVIRLAGSIV